MTDLQSRRTFLRAAAAASAAWAAVDLLQVEDALAFAQQHAAHRPAGQRPAATAMSVLTPDQAAVLDAMTTRILPSVDGRPGAHEAGAVFFIDRSLATFAADQKGLVIAGIQDLNRRAAEKHAKATATFAMMTAAEQDALLREIEQTPFFQSVRFATIVGTFALPAYGGNRDFAGWRMLGLDHQPMFQAPFGYYDAQATQKG